MNRIDRETGPRRSLEAFSPARFETFYEVARLGSVARAAVALGRSQPAVSHRLRALQDELGVELFERAGRSLRLTEAGRRLRDRCADFIAWSRALHEAVDPDAAPAGRVTIGTLPTVAANLLVEPIAELIVGYPLLELAFVFDAVPSLVSALHEGRVDALVVVGELEAHGVDVEPIATSGFAAIMSPRGAPRATGRVSADELRSMRYLAWEGPVDPTFELVRRYVSRSRLSSPASPRIPNIETLRALAAAGAGYAIVPAYTVERDVAARRLVALAPQGLRDQVPILLAGRSGQLIGPGLRAVREAFVRAGRGLRSRRTGADRR